MRKARVLCTVGTRPEAIKMAPVILELRRQPWAEVRVLATAQHRELLDTMLDLFQITPDLDLNIMQPNQDLAALTARLLERLDDALTREEPALALAQGDTTTVLATGLACFYRKLPFCHVEAGLRTGDFANPFPEEMNRVVVSRLARLHFAPTVSARDNLLREGIPEPSILVTGNTVIDALHQVAAKNVPIPVAIDPAKRLILVTGHRRENFGMPLRNICRALRTIAETNRDVELVYPVHPNPSVREIVYSELDGVERVQLCAPLSYGQCVSLMKQAFLIITDSGGIQEEAPALAKPVLVTREVTERPEAVKEGVARVVGNDPATIVRHVQQLLDEPAAYRAMARGVSPYGDGRAAQRIAAAVRHLLH